MRKFIEIVYYLLEALLRTCRVVGILGGMGFVIYCLYYGISNLRQPLTLLVIWAIILVIYVGFKGLDWLWKTRWPVKDGKYVNLGWINGPGYKGPEYGFEYPQDRSKEI